MNSGGSRDTSLAVMIRYTGQVRSDIHLNNVPKVRRLAPLSPSPPTAPNAQVLESGSKMWRPCPFAFGSVAELFDEWIVAWWARGILARIEVALRHRSGCWTKIK